MAHTAQAQHPWHLAVRDALRACRTTLVSVALVSLVINLLMLTSPMFMLQIYDRVLTSRSVPTLVALGGIVAVLMVFLGVLDALRGRILTRIGERLDARLSGMTFDMTLAAPLVGGRQADRVDATRDLDMIRRFLGSPGPVAIFDMPWLPIYLGVVYLLHPMLGLIATIGAGIIAVLIIINEAVSRRPLNEMAQHHARGTAMVEAGRRNAEAARAMGMRPALNNRWIAHNAAFRSVQRRAADRAGFTTSVIKAFRLALQSAILGVGAFFAIRQEVTPGVIIAASIITSRAIAPVELAVSHWASFIGARQSLKRLRKTADAVPITPPTTTLPLPSQRLEVKKLYVAAPGSADTIVSNASFGLRSGDGLGIVGPSGSGKSSLARALVGAWPASGGSIRLDGAEVGQWSPDRLGTAIGYMPQDVQLFDGTIADNIARFDPNASPETVIEAATLANAHEMITGFPKGYDTPVGEAGAILSGGQRQRVALARALYGSPFLIVLDEPESNLDGPGETALTAAIRTMLERGSIVIVIAHRRAAIAAVDKLLVVRNGRAERFGPKAEVLEYLASPDPAPRLVSNA